MPKKKASGYLVIKNDISVTRCKSKAEVGEIVGVGRNSVREGYIKGYYIERLWK